MTTGRDHQSDDEAMRRLLRALPAPLRRAFAWLRRPTAWWARVPLGMALVVGGVFGFLPILGFWMIPVGALLLAEDIPPLRRPTLRALSSVQRWWDRYRTRRGRA